MQNPFNFEPNILPSGPREICLGPKYNFQSFKSPFKKGKKEEEEKKKKKKKKKKTKTKKKKKLAKIKKLN